MKKYIVISGSPRKDGNSDAIAEKYISEIEKSGGEVTLFRVADKKITPCIACGSCKKTGKCIHKDDAADVIEAMTQCDGAVLIAPIYFGDVPGTNKVLIDRFYCLFNPAKGATQVVPNKKLAITFTFGGSPIDVMATVAEKTAYCFGVGGFEQHKAVLCSGNNDLGAFRQNKNQQKDVEDLIAWLLS